MAAKTIRVSVVIDTDEIRHWAGKHADAGRHGVAAVLYGALEAMEAGQVPFGCTVASSDPDD